MRLLILGGDGMLGHQLLKSLAPGHEVKVTLRQDLEAYAPYRLFDNDNAYTGIDVRSLERLAEVFADFRPQAVINAVGIVKQRPTAKESIPSLEINSLLPHRLSILCRAVGARLIHLSTDCIFSGRKGNYQEDDPSDAEDLYGKTKFLGEVHDSHCLTLRTSIIGRELSRHKSLLEWFLAQTGTVKGFTKAIYTGFTTMEMGRIIENMLVDHPEASGVYQVSSDPINKYDLLLLFREKLSHQVEILPDETFCCDRSLDSTRFRKEFVYTPPTWEAMIEEL
ncbi:MAG: SDR family oxidoreductase [Proteobacteria bacterium]|nr:SDR family oxidoreductase [Desulfocapsa sp.]MBU3943846.1 SDR family oxidoreductase [Pseudomonadota bacterium]MCG2745784.1 SDR family oxidoreductase [Desulfobacteraceae bacterium]MBU3984377.1 SDR family oxidoreductase [Pseudomonadota bacterium]MBU4028005.1 SDR family oxidoreductase [Pseudomonadota bacterium]